MVLVVSFFEFAVQNDVYGLLSVGIHKKGVNLELTLIQTVWNVRVHVKAIKYL
jgi:hypothetical protein